MRFGATPARPNWALVGLGLAIALATYAFLIVVGSNGLGDAGASGVARVVALVGYLLAAALLIWGVIRQFTTPTYVLIPIAIAINIVLGQLTTTLRLPVYLDSIGTILVGVLAGPWAGAATGGLANIVWSTFNPVLLPFAIVAIVIGLVSGLFARAGAFRRFYIVPVVGALTGVLTALLSAPLSAFIFNGVTGAGTDVLVAAFRGAGNSVLVSSLLQGLAVDPLDKLLSFLVAYLVVAALPGRLRSRFNRSTTLPQ